MPSHSDFIDIIANKCTPGVTCELHQF